MSEEEVKNETENGKQVKKDDNTDLLETIKDLKTNTVPRDMYEKDIEKLQDERKKLLDIIQTGGDSEEDNMTVQDLRANLQRSNINNLDYVQSALALRNKILSETERDIFEAEGHTVDKQLVDGERVASFLQGCVDKAEGNSEVFTALLTSNLSEPRGIKNLKLD